jgi:hypothetical protein
VRRFPKAILVGFRKRDRLGSNPRQTERLSSRKLRKLKRLFTRRERRE